MTNLAGAIDSALPLIRAQAESMLSDRITVRRSRGKPTTDPDTGALVPNDAVVVEDYPASLSRPQIDPAQFTVAGHSNIVGDAIVKVAVGGEYSPKIGDVIEFTASTTNPSLVGSRHRASGIERLTRPTVCRIAVKEVLA